MSRSDADRLMRAARDARWGLHDTSMQIETPQNLPVRIALPRDGAGAPALAESLIRALDRHTLRPALLLLLRTPNDEPALARLLPLALNEARALLAARHPALARATDACVFGEQSLRDYGRACDPPLAPSTIQDRTVRGAQLLCRWTGVAPTACG